jgi:uncharacterized protein YjbI with pentapeptide repeats
MNAPKSYASHRLPYLTIVLRRAEIANVRRMMADGDPSHARDTLPKACEQGQRLYHQIAGMRSSVSLRWDALAAIWSAVAYPDFAYWIRRRFGLGIQAAGANLTGATLDGANLYGANLTRATLDGANLYGANLYGATLDGANLTRATLDGANLTRANLTRANLTRATLDGANLYGANLDGANLTRANLTRANLTRANLDGAYRRAEDSPIDGYEVDVGRLRKKISP